MTHLESVALDSSRLEAEKNCDVWGRDFNNLCFRRCCSVCSVNVHRRFGGIFFATPKSIYPKDVAVGFCESSDVFAAM